MKSTEKSFDTWLKRRVLDAVLSERLILEKNEEDDSDEDVIDDIMSDEDTGDESSDDEKKMQKKQSSGEDEMTPDEPSETRGGPQKAKAATRTTPTPNSDDLSMEIIVDKLNAIRSGKSLKDEGVRERIAAYFQDMNSAQRLALFAFLEGLAEVIANDVAGDDARSPNDPDIGVKMSQVSTEKEVEEQPNQARVGKQVTGVQQKQQSSSSRGVSSNDSPRVTKDAGDAPPVMVVRR